MVDRPFSEDADDAFDEGEDDSYTAALNEVAPKKGHARPAAHHRRRIEQYWELQRLKQQLADDFGDLDLDEVDDVKARRGSV